MPIADLRGPEANNLRNLDRYVRAEHYRRDLSPGYFVGPVNRTQIPTVGTAYMLLLNASNTTALYTFPRPTYWINGYLGIKVWYSFTSSSGPKSFTVGVTVATRADTLGSEPNILGPTTVTQGSPTANLLYTTAVTDTTTPVTAAYDLLTVRIIHNGPGDAGAANVRYHGGYIEYHPINSQ